MLIRDILHTEYGDVNLDGRVNRVDVATLTRNFGYAGSPAWARGDVTGDGRVGLVDLAIMQLHYGFAATAPAPAAGADDVDHPAAPAPRKLTAQRNVIRPAASLRTTPSGVEFPA